LPYITPIRAQFLREPYLEAEPGRDGIRLVTLPVDL